MKKRKKRPSISDVDERLRPGKWKMVAIINTKKGIKTFVDGKILKGRFNVSLNLRPWDMFDSPGDWI